ncbi:MAG: phosphoribosylformylglycinamidine synthase subunit PurL [Acidobacteriota bacterium]|nr:phosphoribosylformylglycinamidine synthase subunit PurL [Blastocatellia bacterium]MDW8411428.1 phosphoribosylformylglycinamidine synthase subunit PurL [Acidobacteriota bacterium]
MTPETIKNHNLTEEEYERICKLLGKQPNLVELGMFSVMWSEHCSYKSSRIHLARLPTQGECVLQGPGENAGVIVIDDDWCVAFKIESHNHPSFIEPYQGAATGVGGILRDIFTMGARPLAILNSLRFGPLEIPNNRRLMINVVKGISDYGNSFGCPTIGGEVYFADCYSFNPLVNVFALGIVRREHIFKANAGNKGNSVIYVGAKTGRDGIHGATMASAEFDSSATERRPNVQVGDPFSEKLLLEACLEAMRSGAIVGIQDMGAAGLTSSSSEMASRAGTGIDLELSLVPQRETAMSPYEIMLSESQERMLIVAKTGREREVVEIFNKWELDAVVIGQVTDTGRLRVHMNSQLVADIPISALTSEAPVYERPMHPPNRTLCKAESLKAKYDLSAEEVPEVLFKLLASPNLCSRQWIYRQYDHMVRTNTVVLPGSDAAVIRLKETRKALAMTLDGNGRYCELDPKEGAKLAVAESCRNLVVSGARPIAATNCLNFASPQRPEVMWAFSQVIDGLAEACSAFGTPITGGNVSFYNETEGRRIYPTPVIGMVGIIDNLKHITSCGYRNANDVVLLLGTCKEDLGGSEYLSYVKATVDGQPPSLDLDLEKRVQKTCLEAIRQGWVTSAHDVSDGGLLVALVECSLSVQATEKKPHYIGATYYLEAGEISLAATLFGETPSRIILSARPENVAAIKSLAEANDVPCHEIGHTGGEDFRVYLNRNKILDYPLAEIAEVWQKALDKLLETYSL